MAWTLSNSSKAHKESLHPDLQKIIEKALLVSPFDFGISSGYREPKKQFELFKVGREYRGGQWVIVDRSKILTYLDGYVKKSKHNELPSHAFDFFIWIPDHKELMYDSYYMSALAGVFKEIAKEEKIEITWGGDWKKFRDLPHIQLK